MPTRIMVGVDGLISSVQHRAFMSHQFNGPVSSIASKAIEFM